MSAIFVSCNSCHKVVGKIDVDKISPHGAYTRCPTCKSRLFIRKINALPNVNSARFKIQQTAPPALQVPPEAGSSVRAERIVPALAPRSCLLVALLAVAVCLLFMPPPKGISAGAIRAGALTLFSIGFWASGAIPEHLTALIFFLLAMLFNVAPPGVVFSGFQSPALWLIFGGLVIGIAIKRTGLGVRLAHVLVGLVGTSYLSLLSGLVLAGIVLTFVMPSTMGRVILLVPVVLALADHIGFTPGSAGRSGMVMAAALGTSGMAVLPASMPNLVVVGAAQTLYGIQVKYGSYMLLHMPVTGLLKGGALVILTYLWFHDKLQPNINVEQRQPMSRDERALAIVMTVSVGLWASDFLHNISPAWIALGAALFCLLPFIRLAPITVFNGEINFSSMFYVAGVLGMGAVVAESGLAEDLSRMFLDYIGFAPGRDGYNFAAMVGLSTLLGTVTTMPGVPAVLSPLAGDIARATGWPLLTVLMAQLIGTSTLIFPYQAPFLVLAMKLGGVRPATGMRLIVALAVITLFVLTPINYFWWGFLGYFG